MFVRGKERSGPAQAEHAIPVRHVLGIGFYADRTCVIIDGQNREVTLAAMPPSDDLLTAGGLVRVTEEGSKDTVYVRADRVANTILAGNGMNFFFVGSTCYLCMFEVPRYRQQYESILRLLAAETAEPTTEPEPMLVDVQVLLGAGQTYMDVRDFCTILGMQEANTALSQDGRTVIRGWLTERDLAAFADRLAPDVKKVESVTPL